VRKLLPLLVLLAVAAPAGSAATTAGLRGVVKEPRAICVQDEGCTGPTPGVTLVFTRATGASKKVTSDSGGSYRLTLRPGVYAVTSPQAARAGGGVTPASVRVYAGRYRRVAFVVFTGIKPQ
jgi:hypothetical protein